jgi:hypothetical protein
MEIHELMGTHKLMGFCKLMGFHKLMEIHKLVYFHKRKNFSVKCAKKLHIMGLTLYNASINGFTATKAVQLERSTEPIKHSGVQSAKLKRG